MPLGEWKRRGLGERASSRGSNGEVESPSASIVREAKRMASRMERLLGDMLGNGRILKRVWYREHGVMGTAWLT